jgi:hypothetical protein
MRRPGGKCSLCEHHADMFGRRHAERQPLLQVCVDLVTFSSTVRESSLLMITKAPVVGRCAV